MVTTTDLRAKLSTRRIMGSVRQDTCAECGGVFEYIHTTGHLREYCSECQPVVLKRQKRQILREYRQSAGGKAANIESSIKYRQSSKGKATRNRIMNEYYWTLDGRIAVDSSHTKYRQTPKGKVAVARTISNRRERSTNPDSYIARVEVLHIVQEPCTKCKTPYLITHQIDHIIALCLGGTDEWSNLQPLCIKCHRKKSGEDIRELMGRIGKDPKRFVSATQEGYERYIKSL